MTPTQEKRHADVRRGTSVREENSRFVCQRQELIRGARAIRGVLD